MHNHAMQRLDERNARQPSGKEGNLLHPSANISSMGGSDMRLDEPLVALKSGRQTPFFSVWVHVGRVEVPKDITRIRSNLEVAFSHGDIGM